MGDGVEGVLRRGGRAAPRPKHVRKPRRKREPDTRAPVKRSKLTLASFMPMERRTPYARPTTLYSSRQLAQQHIKQASSGRTARMPLFSGTKPTKFAIRRGGRTYRAGQYDGSFVKFSDAFELQRVLQEERANAQREKEMSEMRDAAKKALIAQGLPHTTSEAEEEAAKLKQEELSRTRRTEDMEKNMQAYINKKLAERDLPKDVRSKLSEYKLPN